ncbi:flavin reductase family protein [Nitrococcus mobilis]|nr:flavin reductase family protein [Nitrococcus mobilis]
MERRYRAYRANLINCLSGFKAANLIGTADVDGHSNLAIMSSVVHVGANPPLLGLIIRPDQGDRHTLHNILQVGYYTINHVHESFIDQAHQTSARYPRQVSEFVATGLQERWMKGFTAPFVEQSAIAMGLQLREHLPIRLNGTHLVIGEILHLLLPDETVAEDGSIDIAGAGSVAISGLDAYHSVKRPRRMAYAKPDRAPVELKSL